jgi:hypothetical protein
VSREGILITKLSSSRFAVCTSLRALDITDVVVALNVEIPWVRFLTPGPL